MGWWFGLTSWHLIAKKESLEQMWKPAVLNSGQSNIAGYGFGWISKDVRGHSLVEHDGDWQGFASHIARFVDDRLTVVVLANLADCNPTKIARHVAGLYVSQLMSNERTPTEDDEPDLTAVLQDQVSK
jgi:hypothetical protein